MRASMNALLWEQWRRTRWALLAVFAASTVVTLYCFISPNLPKDYQAPPELSRDFRSFAMILYLLVLFLPLDGSDVKLGLPRYMMTLPCRTGMLASAQLRYGLSSTALLALANEGMAEWLVGGADTELVFLAVSLAAVLYALFWTVGIAAPRPALFGAAAFAVSAVYFHSVFWQGELAYYFVLAEINVTVIGVCVAAWGIRLDRSGELAPGVFERRGTSPGVFGWRVSRAVRFPALPGLRPLFLVEWKRTYRWIPLLSATLFLLSIGLTWAVTPDRHTRFAQYFVRNTYFLEELRFAVIVIPFLVCGITGLLRDTWEYRCFRSGQALPDYCHPVSDRTLVAARWLAGASGIALTEAFVWLILIVLDLISGEAAHSHILSILVLSTLTFAHGTVCWILLWFSPLVLLGGLVICGSLPPELAIIALLVLVVPASLGIVPAAIRRGAISSRWIVFSALFCTVIWYALLNGDQIDAGVPSPSNMAEIAAGVCAIIACLTLAWTPLTVNTMRHRR